MAATTENSHDPKNAAHFLARHGAGTKLQQLLYKSRP
jgi:hypothetical protein